MNTYDYPYDDLIHLCPECRDLMADVVRTVSALPKPPPEPDWSCALRWLDSLCGDRGSVLALDAAALVDDGAPVPEAVPAHERERLESTLAFLDAVAQRYFDAEVGLALRRALLIAFDRRPGVVTGARSGALLALGVIWAVGHANGLLHPVGSVTDKELRGYLGVTQPGSSAGAKVRDAIVGSYRWRSVERPWTYAGYRSRDLEPLGRVELLVSGTRAQLIEVRDRALAAQHADRPP